MPLMPYDPGGSKKVEGRRSARFPIAQRGARTDTPSAHRRPDSWRVAPRGGATTTAMFSLAPKAALRASPFAAANKETPVACVSSSQRTSSAQSQGRRRRAKVGRLTTLRAMACGPRKVACQRTVVRPPAKADERRGVRARSLSSSGSSTER